jgi:SAM-dependent methyltransferase
MSFLKRVINPPLSVSYIQNREISKMLAKLKPEAKVLNIGSKNTRLYENIINVDIIHFPQVDIIGDAHKLPIKDERVEGIIITAVLEIVENPWMVVNELQSVLKDGGLVLATVPFLQPYHPDPTDCHRFTIDGVRGLFRNFHEIEVRNTRGPISMLIWILRDFLATLLSFNNDFLWKVNKIFLGWLLFPFKYLDYILPDFKRLYFISSSFLYVGKKCNIS